MIERNEMRVLGLLFTISVSLEKWVESGLIYREKRIYEEHLKLGHFDKIIWFTYGANDAKVYKDLLDEGLIDKRIEVVSMPQWIKCPYKDQIYSFLLPYIQEQYCKEIDIIKTNQMGGAWTAYAIAKRYGCKFLLRTGYTYSTFLKDRCMQSDNNWRSKIKNKWLYIIYKEIEKKMYRKCDYATVSSAHDKKYVESMYGIAPSKIEIITNFVDCNLFRPIAIKKKDRFVFVGRLNHQKNIFNIIEGVVTAGFGIDIYGDGELKHELINYVNQNQYDVELKGIIENAELPDILNQYRFYILCSKYEGMPKTLLEAMACGLICIGSNVKGISEVIKDNENGFLTTGIDSESILQSIQHMLRSENLSVIGVNARKYILYNHSIEVIVEKENEIMQSMK